MTWTRNDIGRGACGGFLSALALILSSGCYPYHGDDRSVVFRSFDGVELVGSLVVPRGAATKLPSVVLLHGAEPATRSFVYRMHANIFLDQGFAVLLYDKRGAGQSGGDHDSATFDDLINDGLAAIRFLRGVPGIDSTRIGIVGASESGWFTPEIAVRAGDIAFVINKVGPCSSWIETVAWENLNELISDGIDRAVAAEQIDVLRRIWAYMIEPDSADAEALQATLNVWAEREDSRLPRLLPGIDAGTSVDMAYDPTSFIERLTTPILYVYGSEDVNVPTEVCVERLRQHQQEGREVSFRVFEGEGHELGGVGLKGYRFVDGYEELLASFAVKYSR